MKGSRLLGLIIGIMFLSSNFICATGDPVISLSPSNSTIYEGGINGYGKTVTISYDVTGLESCWWQGDYLGFEVWLYVDGNQVAYHRDSERYPVGNHYGLTYSNSLTYYLSQGSHSIQVKAKNFEVKFGLYLDINEASTTNNIQITSPPSITADNNFTDQSGSTHGSIIVSGYGTQTAPFTFEKNSGQSLTLEAVSPQTNNQNYQVIWHIGSTNTSSWYKNLVYQNSAQSYTFTVSTTDNGATYEARLRKLCDLTLSNPGRAIYLNGNTYNSSVTANVVEQNTISPSAEGYFVVNGIEHTFQNLWKSSSSGQNYASVTASQHDTYTAVYRVQAVNPSISFGTTLNMPIVINWTDNPNSNVTQYRIHRREYNNGWSADQIIATVNSGVQTYTDNEYILKPWRQNTWLEYGITAYYTVNSTWSTGGANTQVYGLQTLMQSDESTLINREKETPTDYSISNFPNPFNPTTTINYQLPQDGMVTIKVYDIIGKEVATLVNEQKSAGYYKVDFDASKLTSGVYIATIQASGFNKSIKLLLTK